MSQSFTDSRPFVPPVHKSIELWIFVEALNYSGIKHNYYLNSFSTKCGTHVYLDVLERIKLSLYLMPRSYLIAGLAMRRDVQVCHARVKCKLTISVSAIRYI